MVWTGSKHLFITLTYNQQRGLHDYYLPAKDLTDEQLLAHRVEVTAGSPGLASAAGKAFRQLERTYREVTEGSGGDPDRLHVLAAARVQGTWSALNKKGRRLGVSSLAAPEVDVEQLADALLRMAKEMATEQDQDEAA